MRFTRQTSGRPAPAPGRPGSSLEALESRVQLSAGSGIPFYAPADLPAIRVVQHDTPILLTDHPYSTGPRQLSFLDSEGKVLTGKDRQGDEWTITVHGPGSVIVTDASPDDGVFDDDLNTIQLIGTSPTQTYVTGDVTASARLVTDGVIFFNHLVAADGVASIILNGFTLTRTVPRPDTLPAGSDPEIFLPGGVQTLQFHNIEATLATESAPFLIVIGDPTAPMVQQPNIRIDSIFNTILGSATTSTPPTGPQTTPSVQILINGQVHGLEIVSATSAPIPAAQQFQFSTVDATGRTAVRALGINNLKVDGSARNLTVSRREIPFQNDLSGIDHLGSATFGGNADAVGLDVNGPIGRLQFNKGLGNPTGTNPSPTTYGTPLGFYGYPGSGLLGGLASARRIGSVTAGPAQTGLRTANDPDFIQLYRQGSEALYPVAGNALTNSAIVSAGSIGPTTVIGNAQSSEIKSGFHYPSYLDGLNGTRARSSIGPFTQRGSLIDSVISSSYRASDGTYGNGNDFAGLGRINGNFSGSLNSIGAQTALNESGVGFYARTKAGYLPPPERADRIAGVQVDP